MQAYLDIVRRTLDGAWKENRTGIRTLAVPFVHFEHDMQYGFPLLTTKKMAIKAMAVELEGFIKGITSKKWYQDRGCRIWNEWANPIKVADSRIEYALNNEFWIQRFAQQKIDDLGPIYGYQWRRFNQAYDENDNGCTQQYDQLKYVVDTLKTNPNDRRMVVSAWNPIQMSRMALPACHVLWMVTVINDRLHLHWTQRSCDLMLGVPFNIASYGLLQMLLCEESGLKPGKLSGLLGDCHIYENQIDGAKEQLTREPMRLPTINVNNTDKKFDIFNWEASDLLVENYTSHPKIDFGAVAV